MQTFNCPSCGAQITFTSSISVSCVCPYCRSLVVRHDMNVEAIGKEAELPQDMSPFQIGTGGKHKGVNFGIIGRTRLGWEDGAWNEWFLYRDDGSRAWLAEAQGSLIINAEISAEGLPSERINLQKIVKIEGRSYRCVDRKETECIGIEGELPSIVKKGSKYVSVDLVGTDGGFASVEYGDDGTRLFIGEYVNFDDLTFSNLREVPGWDTRFIKPSAKLEAI